MLTEKQQAIADALLDRIADYIKREAAVCDTILAYEIFIRTCEMQNRNPLSQQQFAGLGGSAETQLSARISEIQKPLFKQ